MNVLTIILIALSLSLDAFAVSVSQGVVLKSQHVKNALKLAVFFGGFQALMPIIGWLAGVSLKHYVMFWDHWIAFGLLSFVGVKMCYEAFSKENISQDCQLTMMRLLVLAIATSIDALAIGITFSFLDVSIILPIILIGIVTFVNSIIGYFIGDKMGGRFGKRIEFVGGVILIIIGFKIVIEHLS